MNAMFMKFSTHIEQINWLAKEQIVSMHMSYDLLCDGVYTVHCLHTLVFKAMNMHRCIRVFRHVPSPLADYTW